MLEGVPFVLVIQSKSFVTSFVQLESPNSKLSTYGKSSIEFKHELGINTLFPIVDQVPPNGEANKIVSFEF